MKHNKTITFKGGNIFDKYNSKNPIVKLLMKKFFTDLDIFLDSIHIIKVLDIGCGEGYITKHIKEYKKGLVVEGIDFYDEVIEIASVRYPEIKFSQGSVYNLPYQDNSFDLLILSEVLEHLEEPVTAINEIKRVSKRYCIITVPNEPLFRIANILRLKYLSSFGNTPGHIQKWTRNDFRKLLRNHFKKYSVKISTLWQIALCEI